MSVPVHDCSTHNANFKFVNFFKTPQKGVIIIFDYFLVVLNNNI